MIPATNALTKEETMCMKRKALAWLARQFVGVVESKPNGGAMVEKFQRAVDGKAAGEAWCVGFVQHCVKEIDKLFVEIVGSSTNADKNLLPQTEWTQGLWSGAPTEAKRSVPQVGGLVVWRKQSNHAQGHVGIIIEVHSWGVMTVEGNTSSSLVGDQREGEGVWVKQRDGGNIPGFDRLGILLPWP